MDHPDKPLELGSEATPATFIDRLLDVVEALDRVLAPHGSLAVELGDSYSGSGGAGGDYAEDGLRDGQPMFRQTRTQGGWPQDKSLALIPETFRWALAYGRNPHNQRTTPAWRVRNVIRWCRPNPPVGALGDKFRPATSELVVACKTRDRWFDLDAVREGYKPSMQRFIEQGSRTRQRPAQNAGIGSDWTNDAGTLDAQDRGGAPPLDWWNIPTEPYPGAHYATWPEALCVRPILAMCPPHVCLTCGQPRRRIVDIDGLSGRDFLGRDNDRDIGLQGKRPAMPDITRTTLGWTDCGHNTWRPGIVLDPFAGSGTTLAVAVGHGRSAIGIDLDPRNWWLAQQRVGMFLHDDTPPVETVTPNPAIL